MFVLYGKMEPFRFTYNTPLDNLLENKSHSLRFPIERIWPEVPNCWKPLEPRDAYFAGLELIQSFLLGERFLIKSCNYNSDLGAKISR